MACHAGQARSATLLLQFWLSLCGALTTLGALAMRRESFAARLSCAALAVAGLVVVGLREELIHGIAFVGTCQLLFEAAFACLPRCFTLGEAAFSAQGLASVVHTALCTLVSTADEHAWLGPPTPSWSAGSLPMELLAVLCFSTLGTLGMLWSARPWLQPVRGGRGNRHGGSRRQVTDDTDPTRVAWVLTFAVMVIYAPVLLRTLAARTAGTTSTYERLRDISYTKGVRWAIIALYWLVLIVRLSFDACALRHMCMRLSVATTLHGCLDPVDKLLQL